MCGRFGSAEFLHWSQIRQSDCMDYETATYLLGVTAGPEGNLVRVSRSVALRSIHARTGTGDSDTSYEIGIG
jgi:hypothetical protein